MLRYGNIFFIPRPVIYEEVGHGDFNQYFQKPDRRPTFEHIFHYFDDFLTASQKSYVPPSM